MPLSPASPLDDFFQSRQTTPPAHLGTRYDRTGTFLPEHGNTIVCHLVDGSETQRALVEARARYLAMPEAAHLAFTPVSSLHMTLFSAVAETRRERSHWARDLPLDMPIDETTRLLRERLDALSPGPAFEVAVQRATPIGLVLDGATEADRRAMRGWRDSLAGLWGLRHPDHEAYPFHSTFAYVIDWLPDEAQSRWQAMLDEVAADIRARAPVLELRAPAFCSYSDMNHFEELRVLPMA
jgi:hypothetical protein